MYIYVQHPSFGILPLEIGPQATILVVTQIIQELKGFPTEDQRLICGNKTLNYWTKFSDNGIKDGALIQLCIGNAMKISILNDDSSAFTLEVLTSDIVNIVKQRIRDKLNKTSAFKCCAERSS